MTTNHQVTPVEHPRFRLGPKAVDFVVVVFVMVASAVAAGHHLSSDGEAGRTAPGVLWCLAALPGCSALLLRRTHPVRVAAVAVLGWVLCSVVQPEANAPTPAVLVALYSVAVHADRRSAWLTAGGSTAAMLAASLLLRPGDLLSPGRVGVAAWIGLATALGDSVRSRRALVAAAVERAERAERTREEEAARRVVEERMRIARELHDVVAHHIALVNAQAGVAVHLMDRRPEQAHQALRHIRDTSREALDELRAVVGLLRQRGDPEAPKEPAPGLDRLGELTASFARAGLVVQVVREGAVSTLPAQIDLAAYRIVQEALTNVRKHAGVDTARVVIGQSREVLRITVTDEGTGPFAAVGGGIGHGLIGIRERVGAVGGTLRAGPVGTGAGTAVGFEVEAVIPLRSYGADHAQAVATRAATALVATGVEQGAVGGGGKAEPGGAEQETAVGRADRSDDSRARSEESV